MRDGTPLHHAKTAEEAAGLIARGASVHARGVLGRTPLHWASQAGRADVVRTLLAAGAKVDATVEHGRTPLHDAAWCGEPDGVAALLAAGADPHVRDLGGKTPLHHAAGPRRAGAADLLRTAMDPATLAVAPTDATPEGRSLPLVKL